MITEERRNDMRTAFSTMTLLWGEMAQNTAHIAHNRKTLFDAYVSEGFTPDQALKLISVPFFSGEGS